MLRAQIWLATSTLMLPGLLLGALSGTTDVAVPLMLLCGAIWLMAALVLPLLRLLPEVSRTRPVTQAFTATLPSIVLAPCALAGILTAL